MLKRIRPLFLLIALGIGTGGYFMCTSAWADLMKLKGAAWFGTEVEATVLDAGQFREFSYTPGEAGSGRSRKHVRLKYEFEVDGETYTYPYEKGFVEVKPELIENATIPVTYWPPDPTRNHPVGKDYKFGDPMAGFILGAFFALTALIMMADWFCGLLRGRPAN